MTPTEWLTLVLVVITGLYCYFTYSIVQKNGEMVAQMKAQYESFVAPNIVALVQIKHGVMVCLKIKNCGQSTAKNLRLTLDRDFYLFAEFVEHRNMRAFPTFQRPIPSLAPGEEIFVMMCQGFNLGQTREDKIITPHEFNIDMRFEFGGKTFEQRYEVDLNAYLHTGQDVSETLQEMEKLRKAVESISSSMRA